MNSSRDGQFADLTSTGHDDITGLTLSEKTVAYLDTRLARGLITPAAAHDHSTVSSPE